MGECDGCKLTAVFSDTYKQMKGIGKDPEY